MPGPARSASDADVEEALRRARISTGSAACPTAGTRSSARTGRELSGGQRQRIVLARALLAGRARCSCSTSRRRTSTRATAEALVRDVFAAAGDRTVLLITHRPEGLDLVDEVVTLDGGRVAGAAA